MTTTLSSGGARAARDAVVVVGAIAWLALAGCGRREAAPGPRLRVVSLHEVTTEIVVALGAADRLVGIDEPLDPPADVAAALAAVPRVSGLESVLATRPALVLGLGTVAEQDPELVARLRDDGVTVALADPATVDDVEALIRDVAHRVGADDAAPPLIARLRAAASAGPRPAHPRRVFVYDCCDPPFTAGGQTVLTDLIARAGGENVFADLDADWTHVSWEAAIARRPELIVIHAYHPGAADLGEVADKRAALRAIPALRDVPVVVLPLGCSLGGLRSIEGLTRLRAAIEGQT